MENYKKILILFLLTAIIFLPYIGLKENLIGNDTYYFLEKVKQNELPADEFPIGQAIIALLEHDMLQIKLNLLLLTFISVLIVAQTGKLFFKQNGWLAGLFIFLSPALFFEMAQLETEQFAIPILFAANYLVLKGIIEKKWKYQAIALTLIAASCLIWKGSIFYLLPLGIISILITPFTITTILLFQQFLNPHLTPGTAYENQFMAGLIYLGPFSMLILGLFLNPYIAGAGLTWLAMAAVNAKFIIHTIPWLALGALHLYNNKNLINLDAKYKAPIWKTVQTVLVISCLIMPLVWGYSITYAQPPTTEQTELIKEFNQLQPAENEWSYGYMVKYYGGNPTAWGGPGDWDQDYNGSYALVSRPLDCNLLRQERYMRLYDCRALHLK